MVPSSPGSGAFASTRPAERDAGWARFDAGRLDEALAEFEHAKRAAERWGTPQQIQWADEALTKCRAALSAERG